MVECLTTTAERPVRPYYQLVLAEMFKMPSFAPDSDKLEHPQALLRVLRVLTLVAVMLAMAHAWYAMKKQGVTWDEPFHYQWSQQLIEKGKTSRHDSMLNSKTPVNIFNVLARKQLGGILGLKGWAARRAFTLVWMLGLFAATYILSVQLGGQLPALLAVTLVAIDPNIIAHGSLSTVDVAFAFAVVLLLSASIRWLDRPGSLSSLLLGFAFGFALLVKFVALLFGPILLLLPALACWKYRNSYSWRRAFTPVIHLILFSCATTVIVCAGYLFIDVGVPLSELKFRTPLFQSLKQSLGWLLLPLPAALLDGIDFSLHTAQTYRSRTIILGQFISHGVWYYFLVLWLLKTPILALLAQLQGLYCFMRHAIFRCDLRQLVLPITLLYLLIYFSLFFNVQVGYRYVLMCIPIASVIASIGLTCCFSTRTLVTVFILIVSGSHAGLLPYTGNPLSYSNLLIPNKSSTYWYFADSNLHWRQNRHKIKGWLKTSEFNDVHLNPIHIRPGRNVFEVNKLWGVMEGYKYFNRKHQWLIDNVKAGGHFGFTHFWFDISPDTFHSFMDSQRSLKGSFLYKKRCRKIKSWIGLTEESSVIEIAADQPTTTFCFNLKHKGLLRIKSNSGSLAVGLKGYKKLFVKNRVEKGKELWYQLHKGKHSLVVFDNYSGFTAELSGGAGSYGMLSPPGKSKLAAAQ